MVTNHQQSLSGLKPATLYHYRVLSTAANNNTATGNDLTFTTADSAPPAILITSPAPGVTVSGLVTVVASASSTVGIASVQFKVDSASSGAAVTSAPYTLALNTTLLSDGNHVLTAVATDTASNSTTSAAVAIKVNNAVPPSVPTGLGATSVSSSQINLSWNASTGTVGVAGYKVYRGGSQIATSSTTAYQDTGLSAATTYAYTVAAFDAAGNTSAQSSSVSATTSASSFQLSGSITPAASGSGATVSLSGVVSKTTTADANGNYTFTGLTNGNYSVAPSKNAVSFSPSSQSVTIANANVTGINFTASVQSFSISGNISPAASGSSTTVTLTGTSSASTTADASGNYTFAGLTSGNYAVAASKTGFTISPGSQAVTLSGANATGINFTATAQTFSLSGTASPVAIGGGITISLSGAASNTTTTDSSGNYTFTGLASGSYTVTPSKIALTFAPTSQAATINGANVTGINFTATAQTYSISGTISPATSGSGVAVSLSGVVSKSVMADANGNYAFTGLVNGGYSVAPSKSGVSFSPSSQPVTISNASVTGINFTASVQAFSISGNISPAASGSGTTVTLTGTSSASTTADASGNYTFTGLINGNYTVAASKAGYALSPVSQPVSLSGTNATGINFTATAQTFSLSGTVGPAAIGGGITISLGGAASSTTTTDSSGNFIFTGLTNGSYTVTPSMTGFTFSPTSQPATVSGANVTGINFTATAPTFTISGTISPAANGSGALVTLSGLANTTATADNSGNFSFGGLLKGTYTVTPSKTGFAFSPTSLPAVINGANVSGLAFTATPSSQNVIFFDDFTTTPLGPTWTVLNRAGDSSGNEQQCNIPGDVSVSNSDLLIVSKVQSMNCQTSTSPAQTYNYTSGAVQWTSFNFTYGTIEYRLQLPSAGQGLRPVIWLLGANCQQTNITTPDNVSPCNWDFPGSEEIDITELIGSYYFSINQALHASSLDYGCVPNVDVSTGFHTYQLVWKPGSLTWNVDGATTCTVNNSNVPSAPMFLIVETTVGGSGGTINNSTLPQTMYLDYVKVTQP
jgi:hypothetical protein